MRVKIRAQGKQRQSNKWDQKTKQKGIAMARPCCKAGAGRDFPTQTTEKPILRGDQVGAVFRHHFLGLLFVSATFQSGFYQ